MAECFQSIMLISAECHGMIPLLIADYYRRLVELESPIPSEDSLDRFSRQVFKHLLYLVCDEFRHVNTMEPVMIMPHQSMVLRIVLDDYQRQWEADPLFPKRVFGPEHARLNYNAYHYWALDLQQKLLDPDTYFLVDPEHQNFLQELTNHYDSGGKKWLAML